MSSTSARRALLFDTPMRPTKRSRTTRARRRMSSRVPRSLLPEMKQYQVSSLSSAVTSFAVSSVPTDLSQGDGGDQFIGNKCRIKRLRVYYDMSLGATGHDGGAVRVMVYIPKRPSTAVTTSPILSSTDPIDNDFYTVLADRIVPTGESVAAGTMDVKMNLPILFNKTGDTVYRNDLRVGIFAKNATSGLNTNMAYSVWFTDA